MILELQENILKVTMGEQEEFKNPYGKGNLINNNKNHTMRLWGSNIAYASIKEVIFNTTTNNGNKQVTATVILIDKHEQEETIIINNNNEELYTLNNKFLFTDDIKEVIEKIVIPNLYNKYGAEIIEKA